MEKVNSHRYNLNGTVREILPREFLVTRVNVALERVSALIDFSAHRTSVVTGAKMQVPDVDLERFSEL
jgi:hypothetical protein